MFRTKSVTFQLYKLQQWKKYDAFTLKAISQTGSDSMNVVGDSRECLCQADMMLEK